MASQRDYRSQEHTRSLPERVGQLYYSHGLFCSSHPVPVIAFAISVVLLCCYPLLNLPMPGNVPQQLLGNLSLPGNNASDSAAPQWFVGPPMVYIQQVIVKTAVCPWTKDMLLTDAFRAPLSEVFKLLEVIHNYQHENSSKTLSHLCLHVEAVKTKSDKKLQLPEYNCLVLSPANLWQQNPELFHEDPNLLSTIYNYQNLQKGKISLAEMLFGMNMKDTGIKRYPLRTRQRVLQFAVTIVFKEYDPVYLNGLQKRLTSLFPLHQPLNMMSYLSIDTNETLPPFASSNFQEVLHVYYPGEFNVRELIPLAVTYFILFLYVYFSVRKIELVKSKVGMAFSALMTALASLFMSVGLCFFFGLTLSLNGRDIFPYLVLIIGLENVLVLTKSVVSTPTHLDVKIRVAQGLSREGWSITKNLLTLVTILTVGFFTFVPEIQKFCIFAVVGLISDFFLQMFFFSTVLAIDIRRMELSTESQHHKLQYSMSNNASLHQTIVRQSRPPPLPSSQYKALPRSRSHPRLNGMNAGLSTSANYPTNVVAPHHNAPQMLVKLPKRLRLVHFWARTRFFQRTFMVFMVFWIAFIVYSSGFVENLLQVNQDSVVSEKLPSEVSSHAPVAFEQNKNRLYEELNQALNHSEDLESTVVLDETYYKTFNSAVKMDYEEKSSKSILSEKNGKSNVDDVSMEDLARLKHSGFDPWRRLSHHHWPAILSMYNISVAGQYISILPSIRLSLTVTPETARLLRNPEENTGQHFQWQALAVALDPLDFSDGESGKIPSEKTFLGSDVPFVPTSPMEIFFTAVLCIISIVVVAYMLVVLYRCVCSRNYAEWRASWAGDGEEARDAMTQVVMDAVPLVLEGHLQEVECLSTDGAVIVSSCLGGHLCVWDSVSGDPLVTIDRKSYFLSLQNPSAGQFDIKLEEHSFSDYESGSPPSRGETSDDVFHRKEHLLWDLPDLRSSIVTNFSSRPYHIESQHSADVKQRRKGFYYGSKVEELYREHQFSPSYRSLGDFQRPDSNWLNEGRRRDCAKRHSDSDSLFLSRSLSSAPFQEMRTELGENLTGNSITASSSHNLLYSSFEEVTDVESAKCVCDQQHQTFGDGCVCNGSICVGNCICALRDKDLFHDRSVREGRASESEHFSATSEVACQSFGSIRSAVNPGDPPLRKTSRSYPTMPPSAAPNLYSSPGSDSIRVCSSSSQVPPIWCLDCHENLIVVGCASGRIEFWEGSTGKYKCLFEDGSGVGVTHVKIIGNRVVAAKLSGAVDFLELKSFSQGQPTDWGFTYRRTHVRTNSAGALSDWETWASQHGEDEDIRCVRLITLKAHQQPITVLDSEGGRVLTGSQDHTLKVFRLEDQLPLYTLHGHTGPISCLFIDRISPMMSGSGSQDGLLCVWDLLTGACMYSIQAHDGSVVALTYSASYVISLGTDERLCVWERFQGHLLNTIQVAHTYCSSMVMLTHNLLITSKQGSLVVWDVRTGVPVRVVKLGHSDKCVFVKQILLLRDSVVCDYSKQLRIVRFPLVTDKCE